MKHLCPRRLVTAFFEDEEEPLTITTPLFSDDDLLTDLIEVFSQPKIDLYFFDEHDREWMGIQAINMNEDRCRRELTTATFAPFDMATYANLTDCLYHRFAVRTKDNDRSAFILTLGKRLYPDNLVIFDTRPAVHQFREAQSHPAITQLMREYPGPPQERDIAVLFSRAFPAENIYLNPFRVDTAEELTDVLVVTDRVMLFVEAKDSPNTVVSLNRSMARKRYTIQKQIEKATKQLLGALSYAQNCNGVTIQTMHGPSTVPLNGRQLLGLVVVREMFNHDQVDNSKPVLELVNKLQIPIMLIDYPGLHMITLNLRNPEHVIDALHNLFDKAIEYGRFPRSVWNGPPLEEEPSVSRE